MAAPAWTLLIGLSLLAGIVYYLKKSGYLLKMLFPIAYFLYARTSLGYYYHQRQIRKRPASVPPHSKVEPIDVGESIIVYLVPYLADNYCYLVFDKNTRKGVAIDPGHYGVLLDMLEFYNVILTGVLTTHKHWDHAGGNHEIRQKFPHVPIYGGRRDSPSCTTHPVDGGEVISISGMTFETIWTPGHTVGHLVYLLKLATPPCLFSGDHLFVASCGKMFEESAETMYQSLCLIKEKMSPSTLIFPGHEYSWANLQFASCIDPHNVSVQEKLESVRKLRLQRKATVPSLLSEELKYNPFLRTDSPVIRERLNLGSRRTHADVLRQLRKEKDSFKPDTT